MNDVLEFLPAQPTLSYTHGFSVAAITLSSCPSLLLWSKWLINRLLIEGDSNLSISSNHNIFTSIFSKSVECAFSLAIGHNGEFTCWRSFAFTLNIFYRVINYVWPNPNHYNSHRLCCLHLWSRRWMQLMDMMQNKWWYSICNRTKIAVGASPAEAAAAPISIAFINFERIASYGRWKHGIGSCC